MLAAWNDRCRNNSASLVSRAFTRGTGCRRTAETDEMIRLRSPVRDDAGRRMTRRIMLAKICLRLHDPSRRDPVRRFVKQEMA
jgi:hypothetical protein